MLGLKQPLQEMFVSSTWNNSSYAKSNDGKSVKKIIMDERGFWPSVLYAIKTTSPLVHVLRIVDGDTPAMGFIYGAMDEAKQLIAKNLGGVEADYKEIWEIIDAKWERQLHRDLHATGYYLNPRYRWSPNVSEHPEIKRGLYNCLERLVPDPDLAAKIDAQLNDFIFKRGLFGTRTALSSFKTRAPVDWWENYGDEVPELKKFALKILGLTCSASECERNWSTFNQVHTKRRNRLSTKKMNNLVYIMYNKRLKQRWMKKKERKEKEDPLVREIVPSDDEWVANPSDDEDEDDVGSQKKRRILEEFDSEDEESDERDEENEDS